MDSVFPDTESGEVGASAENRNQHSVITVLTSCSAGS